MNIQSPPPAQAQSECIVTDGRGVGWPVGPGPQDMEPGQCVPPVHPPH